MEWTRERPESGHDVKKIIFYDETKVCSIIFADFTEKELCVENYAESAVKLAFGNNANPQWCDFVDFLTERCIPKERSGIREYLEALGVDEYSPLEIIKKTAGRMEEDAQWMTVEDL